MSYIRTIIVLFVLIFSGQRNFAQNFQVMLIEPFDDGIPLYMGMNSNGGFGNNVWVLSNQYNGGGVYANTTSQDSTEGGIGQIVNANGNYLHISDTASAISNANYDPLLVTERYAVLDTGFCTIGYTKIVFNFWWLAMGSPGDYGEVFYSVDGGLTWIPTTNSISGLSRYSGKSKWNFGRVTDPGMVGVPDLRFALKWTNDAINTNDSIPFAVDDIMIVAEYGDYDASSIVAVNFISSPICHEDYNSPAFEFTMNDSLCAGVYVIEMSDSVGSFVNSTLLGNYAFTLPAFNPPVTFALPSAWGVKFPTSLPFGTCYSFRVIRLTPPVIVGQAYTNCIAIVDCEDSTRIIDPPAVTQDPGYDPTDPNNMPGLPAGQQPVCIRSVIDAQFYSYGAYNPGNTYILQLSDSTGSFADTAYDIGGPTTSTQTYDPFIYPPPTSPGSMGGQIPVVPEGCNYYLRVVATNPVVNNIPPAPQHATPWGPFCIKECDILTNNAVDISVCITDSDSVCVNIPIDINTWDSIQTYMPGNSFIVELYSPGPPGPPPMTIMNTGSLGLLVDTVSGTIKLCVPKLADYLAIPLSLQMYYMRIIATDGVNTADLLGSLIHLTVSGVSGVPVVFDVQPSYITCDTTDNLCFTIYSPTNPPPSSTFVVQMSPGFLPFVWTPGQNGHPPLPTLCFTVDNFATGNYTVTIQEVQSGDCFGPISAALPFSINLVPDVEILGPLEVCIGDTVVYSNDFSGVTYYDWNFDGLGVGEVIVFGNNEITVVWNNIGSATIGLDACNKCDNEVIYCNENEVTVNVRPYSVILTSPDTAICEGDSVVMSALNATWPIENDYLWILEGDTIATNFVLQGEDYMTVMPDSDITYIIGADNGCPGQDTINITVFNKPDVSTNDTLICIGDSVDLNAFAEQAASYTWTPNANIDSVNVASPTVWPSASTDYIITVVYDSICPDQIDTASVTVSIPTVDAGQEVSIFAGDAVTLNAVGGVSFTWTPSASLDDPTSQSPEASPLETTTYLVTSTDLYGCVEIDSITVIVLPFEFEPEVPDAFTPNGSGVDENNLLYVFDVGSMEGREGVAIETIEFKIFNRWGELIFDATTKEEIIYPFGGWDGTNMRNGKPMEVGVYVWLLEAQSVKGAKIGPISGNVSLLR
ncbi:MAG: gliding motility-associated C-terminal domain-containing protein [Flavobacteriales bacterium]|nr:gliding motility-associated C-terminal domain-containing protein [Flavobacteriales bacterium]